MENAHGNQQNEEPQGAILRIVVRCASASVKGLLDLNHASALEVKRLPHVELVAVSISRCIEGQGRLNGVVHVQLGCIEEFQLQFDVVIIFRVEEAKVVRGQLEEFNFCRLIKRYGVKLQRNDFI